MTPEERAVLERARVATLATADSNGRPHAVPICYAIFEGDDQSFEEKTPTREADDPSPGTGDQPRETEADPRIVSAIDEKPKASRTLQRVRDIRANPRVALLVDHYSEDWSRLAWVQVRGRARVVSSGPPAGDDTPTATTGAVRDAAVDALESQYDQYADHELGERPILEIRVGRTLSWGALEEYG